MTLIDLLRISLYCLVGFDRCLFFTFAYTIFLCSIVVVSSQVAPIMNLVTFLSYFPLVYLAFLCCW